MPITFEQIPLEPGQTFRLLRWEDNVRDIKLCLPRNRTRRLRGAGEQWHFHPEIELTLVARGRGRRFVGDHVATTDGAELVLIGPNLPHYWSGLTGSSGFSLQFVADTSHLFWKLAETTSLRRVLDLAACGAFFSGPIISKIDNYMRLMAEGDETQALLGFVSILSEVASLDQQQVVTLSQTRFALPDRDPHLATISKAVAYVLEHIHDEIALDDLLEVTEMSKPTFCRQFKRHTGRTLVAFINQVRIDYAKQLLGETERPITQIAFESGYLNLSHFNRQFRHICGCSPREYRQRVVN